MPSEYEPVFSSKASSPAEEEAFEGVREHFRRAGGPYLSSPWSWVVWALVLPAAALLTRPAFSLMREAGVLLCWSSAILVGGAVEGLLFLRGGAGRSPFASWVLRQQGNLSLVATALSIALVVAGSSRLLPGVWLLLLGHSFYGLGRLSFPALTRYGVLYQSGGLAALAAGRRGLAVFALTAFIANLSMAVSVWRERRRQT